MEYGVCIKEARPPRQVRMRRRDGEFIRRRLMGKVKVIYEIFFAVLVSMIFASCSKSYSPEQKKYIAEVEKFRKEKDDFMKNNSDSPFNQDTKAEFHPLKYYDVNPDYVFKSNLYEYQQKDTVQVFGTKGEERKAVRYGYVNINYKNKIYKINVYKGWTKNNQEYYSIWFTDETTGKATYGVGRYLDFDPAYRTGRLNPDPDYLYTIDFNLAYNPYCAYSSKYSCAIPNKEDHIALKIEAGEKNFHN